MVCVSISRLKTGRPPDAEGLVPERDFISRSGPNAEAVGVCVGATLPSRCGSQSRAPSLSVGLTPMPICRRRITPCGRRPPERTAYGCVTR